VKGVGKFGEVMAGDKGEADYDASLEKLERNPEREPAERDP